MNIPYSYEIIKVDQAARVMEVVYSSPGRQSMHVGVRIPRADEDLHAVIYAASPVAYWLEQEAQLQTVEVGATGTHEEPPPPPPPTLAEAKERKLAEIAAWRFKRETAGVSINGIRVQTDRNSQAAITAAYMSLKDGLLTSVDWKASDGQWVQSDLAEMTQIAQAVAAHVQACFSMEKQYADMVVAAATVEQALAVEVPA